ncbi:MAG TPA: antibiotic biosynthesis monooxygenase [Chloroflexota bacterium]|nr:antibiotic biosynthesis monooxygenase [Chloroflexota bacterium]
MAGVRLVVQFTADTAEAADERIRTMVDRCRKTEAEEPGCVQYEVFRSALRPEQFALLEHWASQEALDTHRKVLAQNPRPPAASSISTTLEIYEHKPGSL